MFTEGKTHFDAKERIWSGPKVVLPDDEISLGQWTVDGLLKDADSIGMICDNNGHQYTKREIATLSVNIAEHLQEIGLQQEDVIGICATNTDYLAPLVIGTVLGGFIVNPLDPNFTDEDSIRQFLSVTQPKIMFCDGKVYDKVKAFLDTVKLNIPIYTMNDHLAGAKQIQELFKPIEQKPCSFKGPELKMGRDQVALITGTSGTTGPPKAVCVSHKQLITMFRMPPWPQEECILLNFGTIHMGAVLINLFCPCQPGVTAIITDQKFSPRRCLKIVEKYKVTRIDCSPADISALVQEPEFKSHDLTSLKVLATAGGGCNFDITNKFLEHAKFCTGVCRYGMTECFAFVAFGRVHKDLAVGHVQANYEIKIVNEFGRKSNVLEMGEICVRTPFKWPGYFKNPEATKAVIDTEGFYHTGDMGYFNDEECLYVIDRKVDIIKYNNILIYPTQLETEILKIPDVVGACVCNINKPSGGSLLAAAVIKKPNSKLTDEYIKEYVDHNVNDCKQLLGKVCFFDSFPRNSSGKCIRKKVLESLKEMVL